MSRIERIVITLSSLWGLVGGLSAILLLTFAASTPDRVFASLTGTAFAGLAVLARSQLRTRTLISWNALACLLVLYTAQYLLVPLEANRERLLEVLRLRQTGTRAYPVSYPQVFYSGELPLLRVGGDRALPLGGVPRVTSVYCREAGPFLVYESDRHGFNNPDSVWNHPVSVELLGDSYAQGACVPPAGHFVAALRERYTVLNLGMGGNGPLSELATLREYGRHGSAKVVLWLYSGNDVVRRPGEASPSDLQLELTRDATLRRYLSDVTFEQGLMGMGERLGTAYRAAVDSVFESRHGEAARLARAWSWWGRAAQLVTLRHLTGVVRTRPSPVALEPPTGPERARLLVTFRQILAEARREARAWGGRLEFVYLPDVGDAMGSPSPVAAEVISAAREQQIPVVDLRLDFARAPSPSALFAYGAAGGHYSVEGYRLVARALAVRLGAP